VIAYFVLGIGLLFGALLLIKWFTEADPARIGRGLLWSMALAALVFGAVLLWIGRYQFAWLVLPALAGLAGRWREILRFLRQALGAAGDGRAGAGDGTGRSSTVETDFLRMTLVHETGVMTGEVRAGRFAGARLEDLSMQDGVALWSEIRAAGDEQSRQVLESYLDRVHGTGWRAAAGGDAGADSAGGEGAAGRAGAGGARAASDAMSPDEARAVLGVGPEADADTIRAAYRRLMKQVHPDHGGSDYFAMKLNAARRVLLGE